MSCEYTVCNPECGYARVMCHSQFVQGLQLLLLLELEKKNSRTAVASQLHFSSCFHPLHRKGGGGKDG